MNFLKNYFQYRKYLWNKLVSSSWYSKRYNQETRPLQQQAYNSFENQRIKYTAAPVLILHGLYGSKRNFRHIGRQISIQATPPRKVYVLDARNHGESPHSASHQYEDQVNDLLAFLEQHEISKTVVIGHSMGGRSAMALALTHPHLVAKVIVVDVSPMPSRTSGTNIFFKAIRAVAVPKDLSLGDAKKMANEQLKSILPYQMQRDFVLANLIKTAEGNLDWQLNWRILEQHYEQYISSFPSHLLENQYRGPVLFIGGSESDFLDSTEMDKVQKIFPNSSLKIVQGAGHLVHMEQPKEFFKLTLDFINKHPS